MNKRTTRMLAAVGAAIILVLVGVVIANRPKSADVAPQPAMTAAPQPAIATVSQQGSYPISPEQASGVALAGAPGATITGAPMLVSYQGATVYEVTLDTGMIYVDATSGQIIANTATNATTALTTGGQGGTGGDGDGDGEGDDDHDDND
ncbi:PepSY domain-containing protein [Oscillochloris sp. ZM17-4]|uniref:PepSY domain-containing protein n=1 Tax=Oscillochloris sp. ZM17-4 TaxID=2866714 RepID=UPI001C7379B6|nr:PepSY domain-containing protein [Oscillochloris sp. ZM17-4]MBX0327208.1 PepSY domain-containing protein [Oscillochloris sp. ZM17-4]